MIIHGQGSTLKEALNTAYLNTTLGTTWAGKIEEIEWNIGGVNNNGVTPSAMKTNEESDAKGGSIISTDKIGLMYLYDYGYASNKENWIKFLYCHSVNDNTCYGGDTSRSNNWLFNGFSEWTISHCSVINDGTFYIHNSGNVLYSTVYSSSYGVRPVFYLKSDVEIKSDDSDGSSSSPFRIQ